MGLFKQLKDLKETVEAAPGMVTQARQMGAQAQEYAAAQQAAAQMQMQQAMAAAQTPVPGQTATVAAGNFEPIAGVSIELYADISRGLAEYGYDQAKAPEIAASKGVSAESWERAMTGWNERIKADPAVAKRFNQLYMGR